ncbi:hypothetical protein SAMN04488504_102365 [Myxococcus virescens]|uniref:Uncharacterized protein n=1 Tax=Myxococcus virescens TaxID=83456 RepID=A0ABY0MLJ1_9BACT|nr:hypothetical protein SAMN04488504_102365 [Myxococcus virescens]
MSLPPEFAPAVFVPPPVVPVPAVPLNPDPPVPAVPVEGTFIPVPQVPPSAFAGASGSQLPPIPGWGAYPRVAPAGGAATGSAPVLVSIVSIEFLSEPSGANCGGGEKLPGS